MVELNLFFFSAAVSHPDVLLLPREATPHRHKKLFCCQNSISKFVSVYRKSNLHIMLWKNFSNFFCIIVFVDYVSNLHVVLWERYRKLYWIIVLVVCVSNLNILLWEKYHIKQLSNHCIFGKCIKSWCYAVNISKFVLNDCICGLLSLIQPYSCEIVSFDHSIQVSWAEK